MKRKFLKALFVAGLALIITTDTQSKQMKLDTVYFDQFGNQLSQTYVALFCYSVNNFCAYVFQDGFYVGDLYRP